MALRRTRVKLCGFTRAEDVLAAVALGADAIGFVMAPGSPRALKIDAVARLRPLVPPLVAAVLLFRDADADSIAAAVRCSQPDLLQFHGDEDAAFCAQFDRPYLKALALGGSDPAIDFSRHPGAAGFVLDSHRPGGMGGTGKALAWTGLKIPAGRIWLLAGGLSADNVGRALKSARPFGVDVASGIESSPGIKDEIKMRSFIQEVRRFDQT